MQLVVLCKDDDACSNDSAESNVSIFLKRRLGETWDVPIQSSSDVHILTGMPNVSAGLFADSDRLGWWLALGHVAYNNVATDLQAVRSGGNWTIGTSGRSILTTGAVILASAATR